MALAQEKIYTIDDIYALPDGERAELIDGQIYYMAPPSRKHQDILSFLHLIIGNYITQNNGECKIYPAPFAVFLSADDSKYLEPDISVVCDKHKLNDQGCSGAPDWIIEIVSPGNPSDDYIRKLYYYKNYGVREYWIVDPRRKTITVNYFENNIVSVQYPFESIIKVNIYDDLYINFADIAELLNI